MTLVDYIKEARIMDETDSLKDYRSRFTNMSNDLIYLDGNSLGPLIAQTSHLMDKSINETWGKGLIRSWNAGWYTLPTVLGDLLAPLIGAKEGEVCFADSVTINLFKLAASALEHKPNRSTILTDSLNFPSDYYALDSLTKILGKGHILERVPSSDTMTVPADDIIDRITEKTALVTLSHVVFKSGYMHDLQKICDAARQHGAMTLIDLSHSVGSVPVELNEWGVDMAVGCSYKYLNGGPGAPAFLYVRKAFQEILQPRLAGWFGTRDPFRFNSFHEPVSGIRKFMVGSPPILSMQAIEPGIRILNEAGMDQIRLKSVQQAALFLDLYDNFLEPVGFHLGSPRDPSIRGSHLSFRHDEAFRINKAMISPTKGKPCIIPDFRTPDNLRIGIAPLFLRYEDIVRAAMRIQEIVVTKEYALFSNEPDTVT